MNTCDNTSVGVIVTDQDSRLLMFARVKPPYGVAPVASHVDDHGSVEDAARAEVAEEVGLTVTGLQTLTAGWRPNVCRRPASAVGHHWIVFHADVDGQLRPGVDEVRAPRWYTPVEIQALADRTVAYAHGDVTPADFAADPGLEPVWAGLLADTGFLNMAAADVAAVEQTAARVTW